MVRALLLLAVMLPALSPAAVLFSEDWESGTPPATWPYKQAPSACDMAWQGNVYNGWRPEVADYCTSFPSWNQIGRSSARAHGGTYSFFHRRASGTVESGDIGHDLPTPYKTKIYIQFWIWFDSNFAGINTPTTIAPEGLHFLFTNTAQSGTGLRVNLYTRVPYTSPPTCGPGYGGLPNSPFMFFSIQNDANDFQVGTYSNGDFGTNCYNLLNHTNQWIKVQFMFDAANDVSTIWIDDVQRYTANSAISQSNFTWIMFSAYGPSDMDGGSSYTQSYYLDDITVSDTFISGGGGTTYTVTPSAGANGSISPNTAQTVNSGSTTTFTVTPSGGYTASVGGTCGGTLVGSTFTTSSISADCTVSATFSSADTTPPVLSGLGPTANLSSGATTASVVVTTDEAATCKYATASGVPFGSMTPFGTTGNTAHATSVPVVAGGTYWYYLRCQDGAGNASAEALVRFAVDSIPKRRRRH